MLDCYAADADASAGDAEEAPDDTDADADAVALIPRMASAGIVKRHRVSLLHTLCGCL